MSLFETPEVRLALSLVLGLLLGVERERRKHARGRDSIAGLRTFGLVGFFGGIARYTDIPYAVVVGALLVGALVVVGYALDPDRGRDKGLTTEVALVLTYVLGALAITRPDVAGIAAIVTTTLLHFRDALHRFVAEVLHEDEVHDGLLLLVFAFVLIPLAPDIEVGPYGAVNPQRLARLMLVVTLISSGGYVAQRFFGAKLGLVATGLGSGFVSSSATIAALGLRTKKDAGVVRAAAAGAIASSIATIVQYGVVVVALDRALLAYLAFPLGFALVGAIAVAFIAARGASADPGAPAPRGRAFQVLPALAVGAGSAVVSIVAQALSGRMGDAGIVVVSTVAGFVDAHATAGSVASLHHGDHLETRVAELAILGALSANTLTKIVMASISGVRAYAWRVAVGVLVIAAAAWLGFLVGDWTR